MSLLPGLNFLGGGTVSGGGGGGGLTTGTALSITGISPEIATAGRLSFLYSFAESSDPTGPVTLRFYVQRTHGCTGAVGCTVTTGGDTHENQGSTALSWASGDMSVKYVDITITASDLSTHASSGPGGEFRIDMLLSSATGGAVLHFGSSHTRAYGIIDDNDTMIASDEYAVFLDTTAGGGGDGSQSSPYNDLYTAISNVTTERYLYMQGSVTPVGAGSGGHTDGPYTQTIDCIPAPGTRAGESTRLIIRNWPGQTITIDGGNTGTKGGFFAESSESYHTYKNIAFQDLTCASQSGMPNWGIWYHYGSTEGITVEHCTFDGIHGGSGENTGAINFYGNDGCKAWKCTANNISTGGSFTNQNTACFYTYRGENLSAECCDFGANVNNGIYDKQKTEADQISIRSVGCIYRGCNARYQESGGGDYDHNGILFQYNLMYQSDFYHKNSNSTDVQSDNQISNNYFFQAGSGSEGAMEVRYMGDAVVYDNIFDDCDRTYSEYAGDNAPRYLDYNCVFSPSSAYQIATTSYATSAALNSAISAYAGNDVTGDPNPVDLINDDPSLDTGSSALDTGIAGNDMGVFPGGYEQLGAA